MAKITIVALITEPPPSGLGYCCPWVFFRKFKQTALIAARLGVSTRAVRYHKELWRAKCYGCEGRPNCMKGKL
jgi:hypothetical protein